MPAVIAPLFAISLGLSGLNHGPAAISDAELARRLPHFTTAIAGDFGPGVAKIDAVLLSDVAALLGAPASDTILARCSDGYLSVFTPEFVARYGPFIVVAVNGKQPSMPVIITEAEAVAKGVSKVRDIGHKQPWGVISLEFVPFAQAFGAVYRGPYERLSPAAAEGRTIWINSCASCHGGPAGIPGGTRSGQPYAVLQAIAGANPDFFRQYVKNPRSLVPAARMEPHPLYSRAELDDLIAFLAIRSDSGR